MGQGLYRRVIQPLSFRHTACPEDPEVDEPGVPPERVHLNVARTSYNVRSSIVDPFPWFSVANLKFVYTDYKHNEIDNNTVGATFKTNGVDSRIELVHKPIGPFEGSIGSQVFYKDLSVLGEEAFLQPNKTWRSPVLFLKK